MELLHIKKRESKSSVFLDSNENLDYLVNPEWLKAECKQRAGELWQNPWDILKHLGHDIEMQ